MGCQTITVTVCLYLAEPGDVVIWLLFVMIQG